MVKRPYTLGSPFVFVGVKRDGGITFASRTVSQGAVTYTNSLPTRLSPAWVKIAATNTTLTASTSSDGITWTSAGSISGSFGNKSLGITAINRETYPDVTLVHANFDRMTVLGPLNIYAKAGSSAGYTNGSSTFSQFNLPSGVCIANTGDIFVTDSGNHRIRKIAVDSTVSSIAGTGIAGSFSASTVASAANLNNPKDVASDSEGRLYIVDSGNHCIRRLNLATGIISTFAGTPTQSGFTGDGSLGSAAKFSNPTGIAVDVDGNVYVADTGNNRIRRIDFTTGIITTVAGGGNTLGDGGLAVAAMLVAPLDVATDILGNLYIADSGQFRVRKVNIYGGSISTIAGTGVSGYTGNNGAATAAKVGTVNGIAVDEAGNVWFSDVFNASNHRIRRIAYPSGIISAVAGVGAAGLTGDNGSGVAAKINNPIGLAVGAGGELIFADSANHRIRRVK